MKEKILLDTDIGSDIDDAVCLAYLLANDRCDLLGITTVTGQPQKRAALASALCSVAGKRVPIHSGSPLPLFVAQKQPEVPQAAALSRWPHESEFPPCDAVEFLRGTIRAHPGEITLLAIGPFTNLGLLFSVDPEVPGLLKALVLMGGSFTTECQAAYPLEWNVRCDPHAAAIVYRTAVKTHRSIGLDVTKKVSMTAQEVRARFTAPLLRPVLDFAEVCFGKAQRIVFHDPLAAATIFDASICRFEPGSVKVEIVDPQALGKTEWCKASQDAVAEGAAADQRGAAPHEIAVQVDPERFFDHYFSVFG